MSAGSADIVGQELRSKGYRPTTDTSGTVSIDQYAMSICLDEHTHQTRTIRTFSQRENHPEWYVESYRSLREWVLRQSMYREELAPVLWPTLLHSYLELLSKDFMREAQGLLDAFGPDHEALHERELKHLSEIKGSSVIGVSEVARTFQRKMDVEVCERAFEQLREFLEDSQLMLLMSLITTHITFHVTSKKPLRGEAPALLEKFKEVRWGVLEQEADAARTARDQVEKEAKEPLAKEKEDEVGGDKGSEKGAKKRKTPVPVEEEEQEEARVRPHERISIEVPSQTMKSAIAIPPMSEVSKLMQLANLRQRAVLSSTALPSIAFYTFLNSHKAVNSVALDAEGAHAAACMADSTVRLWDLVENRDQQGPFREHLFRTQEAPEIVPAPLPSNLRSKPTDPKIKGYSSLVGHSAPVYSCDFSYDGQYLLTSSADCTVRLWSLETKLNLVVYKGHSHAVWKVRFSPLGFYFASASQDGTARLWSTATIFPLRMFVGHQGSVDCVEFHPNCNYLATGSADKTVRFWDVQSGDCVRLLTGPTNGVRALAFSPDGRSLAGAGEDTSIYLWDLATGKCLQTFRGHTGAVTSLRFSRQGRLLASGSLDNTVRLWNTNAVPDADVPAAVPTPAGASDKFLKSPALVETYRTKSTSVIHLQFTPRNLLLASGVFAGPGV